VKEIASGHRPATHLSRRAVLRWLARGAAGTTTAALLGATRANPAVPIPTYGAAPASATVSSPGAGDATLADRAVARLASPMATAALPTSQVFRSRPDLRPPVITMDVPAGPTAVPGLVLTDCHGGPTQQGPLILDGSGELVWFLPLSGAGSISERAFNVQCQSYKGRPVLTWFQGAVVDAHGEGHYELYDSAYRAIAQVYGATGYQGDLHELVLTGSGTALFTCYGQASANLTKLKGDAHGAYFYGVVQEVDIATGNLLFEWRSDEHVALEESYQPITGNQIPWDYFHINSIAVDPTDGNLIVSGRNTWTFYKVDRSSGKVLWRVGGKASDFDVGPGAHFAFQHHVRRWSAEQVTLFDNEGGPPAEAPQSRGVVLDFDEKGRKATLLTQYHHSPPVLTEALGSVQDLPRGHRFVGWGESSYFTEYDASGRVVLDGRLVAGTESYRAFKHAWEGQPAGPPTMAVVAGKGTATVYASWNGATGVQRWAVLGGADATKLSPVHVARRSGFETVMTVPRPPPYLAVEALDSNGAALGRSAVRSYR
jgi:hypothetical protein